MYSLLKRAGNQKGFTVGELLITMAIMMILSAFGGVAVNHYQSGLHLMERDSIAKSLFMTAQNQLTIRMVSGEWQAAHGAGGATLGLGDGEDRALGDDGDGEDDGGSGDGGDFSTIIYTNGGVSDGEKNDWELLLPPGSIDDHVRTACSYQITYNPTTGQIIEVFFGGEMGLESGDIDQLKKEKDWHLPDTRKNFKLGKMIIGYYGALSGTGESGTPGGESTVEPLKPSEPLKPLEITVNNGVILMVTIKNPNPGNSTKIRLILEGKESKKTVTKELSKPSTDDWYAYSGDDTCIVALDNIVKSGCCFADLFGNRGRALEGTDEGLIPGEDVIISAEVAPTYGGALSSSVKTVYGVVNSLFGEKRQVLTSTASDADVSGCTVMIDNFRHLQNLSSAVSGVSYGGTPAIQKAELTKDLNLYGFFGENISQLNFTVYGKGGVQLASNGLYSISGDSDGFLKEFRGKGHLIKNVILTLHRDNSDSYSGLFGYVTGDLKVTDLVLEEITSKGAAHAGILAGKVEGKLEVSGLEIANSSAEGSVIAGGVAAEANMADVKKVILQSNHITAGTGGTAGGVVGKLTGGEEVDGKLTGGNLSQIVISKVDVSAEKTAGGLVGEAGKTIEATDISLVNSPIEVTAGADGTAGGMIGAVSGGKLTLTHCSAYLEPDGGRIPYFLKDSGEPDCAVRAPRGTAGGIVGRIDSGEATINQSFAAVPVTAGSPDKGIAGGLIGAAQGKSLSIENSYSSGYAEGGDYKYPGIIGSIAGGLIGQDGTDETTVTMSYTTAYILGNAGKAGGFFGTGTRTGNKTYSNSYIVGQVWENYTDGSVQTDKSHGDAVTASYESCYVLKRSGLSGNGETVPYATYDELVALSDSVPWENSEKKDTEPYGQTPSYPFPMVAPPPYKNQVKEAGDVATTALAHYGDWPAYKESQETEFNKNCALLYYEIVDGKLYYHGMAANFAENGISEHSYMATQEEGLKNGLVQESGKYVTEDGYILLVKGNYSKDEVHIAWNNWSHDTIGGEVASGNWDGLEDFNSKNNELLKERISNCTAYYLKFNTVTADAKKLYVGIRNDENKWLYTSFVVSPSFADGVGYGQSHEWYGIRSIRHLYNISKINWLKVNTFRQTLDIEIDKKNSYTVNGDPPVKFDDMRPGEGIIKYYVDKKPDSANKDPNDQYYSINNLNSTMFGQLNPGSHIKGITLKDLDINGENACGLASSNYGIIEQCYISGATLGAGGNVSGLLDVNHGIIEQCHISDATLDAGGEAAGLVGSSWGGKIINSTVEGSIKGKNAAGFIGTTGVEIEGCWVKGSVEATGTEENTGHAAGFVLTNQGQIKKSYYASSDGYGGSIKGKNASGFVDYSQGTIRECYVKPSPSEYKYSSMVIDGTMKASGFVRDNNGGNILDSFFAGTVRGNVEAETTGFVFFNGGTIAGCYASGLISGKDSAGFVFNNNGTIQYSFVTGSVSASSEAAGFVLNKNIDYIKPITNCYTALWKLECGDYETSRKYPFAKIRDKGHEGKYENCAWLDTVEYLEGPGTFNSPANGAKYVDLSIKEEKEWIASIQFEDEYAPKNFDPSTNQALPYPFPFLDHSGQKQKAWKEFTGNWPTKPVATPSEATPSEGSSGPTESQNNN